jgi:hypothetical protein
VWLNYKVLRFVSEMIAKNTPTTGNRTTIVRIIIAPLRYNSKMVYLKKHILHHLTQKKESGNETLNKPDRFL